MPRLIRTSSVIILLLLTSISEVQSQDQFELSSPDERITITITVEQSIQYAVDFNGQQILAPSALSLNIKGHGALGNNPELIGQQRYSVDKVLKPVVAQKSATISDKHNELRLSFARDYDVVFRAYNDGIAYRFETDFDQQEVIVHSEQVEFNFNGDHTIYYPEEESFLTHQERSYLKLQLSDISSEQFGSIPTLIDIAKGPKVLINEANLQDYPGYYLQGTGSSSLTGIFPHFATEERQEGDRTVHVTKRADYLAETSGSRAYPWRVLAIAGEDAELLTNQLIHKLAEPNRIEDPSWIRPGKVAWDWWNANNIYGVDFESGVNTETYKYYIDFAAEMGLDYIILDEGWYELGDLTAISDGMDVEELIAYGKSKDVEIILWVVWKTLEDQWDIAFQQFKEWDVAGIKVDFMQRDDQWMVNWYWKLAEEAARHELLVDFHGSYKPTGLRRTYPNVITREDLKGMEHNKWSEDITAEHNLTLPFIRMVAGPMDYTPGAMINAIPQNFRDVYEKPMSMTTRAQELAKYVVYESPLQMLCDSPSHYYEEEDHTLDYLSTVPVTWDETLVIEAQVADYAVLARRKGDAWYLAAMTDENARSFTVNLSFLEGENYDVTIFEDGINADRYASDYQYHERQMKAGSSIQIDMKPGGGWVGVFQPSD